MNTHKLTPPLKTITIDSCPIVSERLRSLLSEIEHVEYLGNAQTISQAHSLLTEHQPQIIILDIHLEIDPHDPEENNKQELDFKVLHFEIETAAINGFKLLLDLRKKHPKVKIIVLTNLKELQYRLNCLAFGADHFFDKTKDFEKIAETIKKIRSSNS